MQLIICRLDIHYFITSNLYLIADIFVKVSIIQAIKTVQIFIFVIIIVYYLTINVQADLVSSPFISSF